MKHCSETGEAFENQLMNSLGCHSNLENPWQITMAIMLPYICIDPLFSKVYFFGFDVIGFLHPPCDVKRGGLSVSWWWIKKKLGQGHPASEWQNSHEKPGYGFPNQKHVIIQPLLMHFECRWWYSHQWPASSWASAYALDDDWLIFLPQVPLHTVPSTSQCSVDDFLCNVFYTVWILHCKSPLFLSFGWGGKQMWKKSMRKN